MKKFFLMLLALMMAMTTLTAFAEEEADMPSADEEVLAGSALLQGFVMEVMDESILVLTRDGLYVEALMTESTVLIFRSADHTPCRSMVPLPGSPRSSAWPGMLRSCPGLRGSQRPFPASGGTRPANGADHPCPRDRRYRAG